MKLFRIFIYLIAFFTLSFSNELVQKDLYDKNFSINKGSFKIVEFDKMVKNIKVNDKEIIEVDFIDNNDKPLQSIKIFAKNLGHGNILVTFIDSSSMHVDLNVVENLSNIILIAKNISPELKISQVNGKIILEGTTKNQNVKDKILDLFAKAGIELKKDLVDLISLENPDKMIRLKLFAVEIDNTKGLDLTHNWVVSSRNYTEITDGTLYANVNSNAMDSVNAQRSNLVNTALDNIMANAVTLSGGLTGAANYLGRWFNTALTLNYLSSKGVANVLDETTLLTLENQNATFHSGGTIYLKIATTTDQGVPTTQVRNINYGLQLDIKAQNIVDEQFVNLDINTKSTGIDWANTVDGIPSFTEKSIKTNVVVGNQSTIILGGLVTSSESNNIDKIPLLGDIPILGKLFTSKSFKEGRSELVFFITPEIVDPKENNQLNELNEKTLFTNNFKTSPNEPKEQTREEALNSDASDLSEHERRVKEFLGY